MSNELFKLFYEHRLKKLKFIVTLQPLLHLMSLENAYA